MERQVVEIRQQRLGASLVERRDADLRDVAAALIDEAAYHGPAHRQAHSTSADVRVNLEPRRVERRRGASELERRELQLRVDVSRKAQPAEAQDVMAQRAASQRLARSGR